MVLSQNPRRRSRSVASNRTRRKRDGGFTRNPAHLPSRTCLRTKSASMPDPHPPETDLDLTRRRAAEVAARAASPSGARMLAAALDAGTEHIYVMDRDGHILFA